MGDSTKLFSVAGYLQHRYILTNMIAEDYILSQVKKSKEDKRTSSFIRNFIFKVVDEAAVSIYGQNYSNRCAQTSEAIKYLLNEFGIESKIFVGSLCVLEVFQEKSELGFCWGGFWDDQSHLFNITEYSELVDLTISQIHLNQNLKDKNIFPLLPFWWQPFDRWPPIIKYLPDGPSKYGIPEDDKENFGSFINAVKNIKDNYLTNFNREDITFGTIVFNVDTLDLLTQMGNPWLTYTSRIIDNAMLEYPEFIIAKEKKMIENYHNKKRI